MSVPYSWRITVEYQTYQQAQMATEILKSTAPQTYVFDALDRDGEPLWHEQGSLHFRPERVK